VALFSGRARCLRCTGLEPVAPGSALNRLMRVPIARSMWPPKCGLPTGRHTSSIPNCAQPRVSALLWNSGALSRCRHRGSPAIGQSRLRPRDASHSSFERAARARQRVTVAAAASRILARQHWGFVLRGQITTTDIQGGRKTVRTNDLFYWPPGHNVRVDEGAEIIMFSPQHEHTHVIDHMREKVGA
jgi:hypothetical protein